MKGGNRVSAAKIEGTANGGDRMERRNRPLEIPRRHPDLGRRQFSWVRRNEIGTFRNDRDGRKRKTGPNIPESCRA